MADIAIKQHIVIKKDSIVFLTPYEDIYAEELNKRYIMNSYITSRNGDLLYTHYITVRLGTPESNLDYTKPIDRKNLLETVIYKFPFPRKPEPFAQKEPGEFIHRFIEPVKRTIQYEAECVISMESIRLGDTYWECNTCSKCVLYDVYSVYRSMNGAVSCPHCRGVIDNPDMIYINCDETYNISNTKLIQDYNMKVDEHNSAVMKYLAGVKDYQKQMQEYNKECAEIETKRTQYLDDLITRNESVMLSMQKKAQCKSMRDKRELYRAQRQAMTRKYK